MLRAPIVIRGFRAGSSRQRVHPSSFHRAIHFTVTNQDESSLKELYAKFQDPTSHYHIPPGTSGPEHEEDHSTSRAPPSSSSSSSSGVKGSRGDGDRPWLGSDSGAERKALDHFGKEEYDTLGVLRWPVAWGDCDMFQHVNNVRILGWFESARIRYAESWASELPTGMVNNMLLGKGIGFILKDVSLKYKAPVTYPDTIMISSKLHTIRPDRASFGLKHLAWSMKDERVTAICDSTIVMYDYDNVKKGIMVPELRKVLEDIEASYSSANT